MASAAETVAEVEPRALASIQRIRLVKKIDGCDLIALGEVLGYTVIVKYADFPACKIDSGDDDPGELCVFFEPDSVLDATNPDLEFLRSKKWRIGTMKMRGFFSQGLAMPIAAFVERYKLDPATLVEGQNVTKELRVCKYISPEECAQYCSRKSPLDPSLRQEFPVDVPKTDEPNIQRNRALFTVLYDSKEPVTITEKIDGCSATFWADGLASRNFTLMSDKVKDLRAYWEIERRYRLCENLKAKYPDLAIQGEITGPGINKNRLQRNSIQFQVFNIWHKKKGCYLPWDDVKTIAADLGLAVVPELYHGKSLAEFEFHQWYDLLRNANGRHYYNENGKEVFWSEGVVCKGFVNGQFISFKVVSQNYLTAIHK